MDLDYFLLLIFVIPFALAYFMWVWFKQKSYLDYLIPIFIFFSVAFRAIFSSIAQIFFSEDIAAFLNQVSNPFIKELGFANMAMGLSALIAIFYAGTKGLLFASLSYALYLSLSSVGHLSELIAIHNLNLTTIGDLVFTDLLTPITLFILYYLRSRYE